MAFKIKDGVVVGTKNVLNSDGQLISPVIDDINSTFTGSIALTTLTADRTYTFKDASGTVAFTSDLPGVATSTVAGLVELFDNTVQSTAANAVTTTASRTYGLQLNAAGQAVVNVPWTDTVPNSGALTVSVAEDGTTGNSVYITTGTGFNANSSSAATYDVHVGPSLKNLADTMTGAGSGFLKKNGADTYTVDTSTYLTAEADTLQTVTSRGATSSVATVTLSANTASTTTGTGALVVTGGVGIGGAANIGGNVIIGGNLTVNGTTITVNSTVTTLDDPVITLGGDTAPTSDDNKDRGVEFRWHNGTVAKVGFFGFDDSTGKFTFIPDATNTSEVFSGTKGTIDANIDWADILNKPTISDTNTTYSISAETVTGGANLRLTGSDAVTDDVKIASGTNVTVTRTDANTITIAATDTTYSKATSTTLGLVELFDNTVQTVAANAVTTTASRTYGIQLNAADQMVVNVPWTDTQPNNGALTLNIGAAGGTNTTVTVPTGTGFTANSSSASTYQISVGPALTALASTMTGAGSGFLKKTAADTYTVDTNTYLTSQNTSKNIVGASSTATADATATNGNVYLNHLENTTVTSFHKISGSGIASVTSDSSGNITVTATEADTLQTVTGRGATSNVATVTLSANTASTTTGTGTLVVTGGVGIGGNVHIGGTSTTRGEIANALSAGTVITSKNVVQSTVATTATTAIDTWAIATYRSAKYVVQITQGTNYQVSEVLVIHNGTTTSMTEFAVLETNGSLGTITSDISGGNARLLVTMGSATSATINIERVLMVV